MQKHYIHYILGLLILITIVTHLIPPKTRSFSIDDRSISNEFKKEEMVPNIAVVIISQIIPLIIIGFILFKRDLRYYSIMKGLFYCLTAQFLTLSITNFLKITVGRLRPDFLGRCQPIGGKCTGSLTDIIEGRKSFPSGHSSVSFCGSFYLVLFLREHETKYWVDVAVALFYLAESVVVAITRILDFRHHFFDVVSGACIGIFSASIIYAAYRRSHLENYTDK